MEIKQFLIKIVILIAEIIIVLLLLMLVAKLTNLLVMLILSPFIGLVYRFTASGFVRWKKLRRKKNESIS